MCSGYGAKSYDQVYLTMSSSAIDQNLTIYIPYMEKEHANKEYIKNIFKSLDIGIIDYVYFENNTAIIYMQKWNNNVTVQNLQEKIKDGHRQARLVHDDPNYWVLLENKDSKKMIIEQVAYTETLNATMFQMVGQLEQLSNKFEEFEKKYEEANWILKLQDNYHKNLKTDNSENKSEPAANMYKNNSCCGAASDAWVPSYPSTESSNWREWHVSKM